MNNESMVYLNKIFTDIDVKSCPLLSELVANGETFDQQLTFFDQNDDHCSCGCGCNSCLDFDDDPTFVIDSTEVIITDFNLSDSGSLTVEDVTVDGITVDTLDFFNQRFIASTNNLLSQISDCACINRGQSTKGMLLIQNAGSWTARVTIIIRGSVFGCSGCKRFRLRMSTTENTTIDIPGTSTFAVSSICLPCIVGGIAPVINFSFDAKATLLNPNIITDTGNGNCSVIVTGSLVTEPIAEIQVTRQTLFRTNAEIVEQPCDDARRCRAYPDSCNCVDDASEAVQIRNRCCGDAVEEPCEHNADAEDKTSDCELVRSRTRQISCQWNGCNGCGF